MSNTLVYSTTTSAYTDPAKRRDHRRAVDAMRSAASRKPCPKGHGAECACLPC